MKINKFREIIERSEYIVFLGGAGTSTESQIPDFRSSEGLYSKASKYNVPPEEILSIKFFNNQTASFYEYYRENLIYPEAKPNKTHKSLFELERQGKLKMIITQNIDGLHQMAGSCNVTEIHGSLHRNHCQNCGKTFELSYVLNRGEVPLCDECNGIIRPDVIMYGEPLDGELVEKAIAHMKKADLLIIGGTSLLVYPAAGLIRHFFGHDMVIINKTKTKFDPLATMIFNDPIGEVLGSVVNFNE
ncbi:MAG: NAD-dependent protein deacylase [Clostridiales bacterium]|nr:NAD-dependent protein deacylase [Clostridiales bacterium]